MRSPPVPVVASSPKRISPTQVEVARGCALQFILNSAVPESASALPSPSPARYAGSAFHGLIEAARRGEAGDPPSADRLSALWQEQVARVEEEAKGNGDECWVPLHATFQGFQRTRLWAIRLALSQDVVSGGAGRRGGGDGPATEAWLESRDSAVAGKVDAIDSSEGHLVLRDFKSGAATESGSTLRSAYVTQMLLYAALHRESRGAWPDRLEVVDRRGHVHEVAFSHDQAAQELQLAKDTLGDVVARLGEGGSARDAAIAAMGTPSGEICRFCRHRPSCAIYLGELQAEGVKVHGDSDFAPVDIVGRVVAAGEVDGRLWLRLEHGGVARTVQGYLPEAARESGERPAPPDDGALVAVFGAMPRRRLSASPEAPLLVAAPGTRAYVVGSE